MIIGINGYAGSGKDTVGTIIQYVNCRMHNNTSIEEACMEKDENEWWLEEESGWQTRKFAGKLKDIAAHLLGIDVERFEEQHFKKQVLDKMWWTQCNEGTQPMTVREFLQKLGTDALRNGLHENVWVNALMADYVEDEDGDLPNWIVTDVRFPNEAQAIKDQNGYVIRIERPGYTPVNAHASETALDNWNFDYKLANVSDIFALKSSVEQLLRHLKLIK